MGVMAVIDRPRAATPNIFIKKNIHFLNIIFLKSL